MAGAPRRKPPSGVYRIAPGTRPATPAMPVRGGQTDQPARMRGGKSPAPSPAASSGTLRRRRSLSLRARMILALLSVAALPMLATAGGGILLARNSLITQGQQSLLSRANATASKIEGYIAQSSNSLLSTRQVVAAVAPALDNPDPTVHQATVASLEQVLADERAAHIGIAGGQVTRFINTAGVVVAADPSGDEGLDLHSDPVVVAALAGQVTIAPVTFDPSQSSDLRETFVVAAPVFPANTTAQGHPIGALYERFSLQQIVAWVHEDSDGAGGGGILIEPDTGVMLAESLPPAQYTFATLAPLSTSAAHDLIAGGRYVPTKPGQVPPVEPIPGLSLTQVGSAASYLTAGTFGGNDSTALRYARVDLTQAPDSTPWVYMLGIPQTTLTAPADSLGVLAAIILTVALVVGLVAAVVALRQTSQWLTNGMRQLGDVATAFLKHSDEQRQTAEEQRRRLTGARSALHDLHQLGSEISVAIEAGIGSLERGTRGQPMGAAGGAASAADFTAGEGHGQQAWWTQWAGDLRERLLRQHEICDQLGGEARVSTRAANHLRERGTQVYSQAAAIDAALRSGDVQRLTVARGQPTSRAQAAASANEAGAVGSSGRFGTGWLRVLLLGVLLFLGVVPSIAFATISARGLRRNLTSQSTQALELQAQSDASAVDALLAQQIQEVTGLSGLYLSQNSSTSGVTSDVVSQELGALVLGEAQTTGTSSLQLVSVPDGTVVAASSAALVGGTLRDTQLYQTVATKGVVAVSPVSYDPIIKQGYYAVGVPVRNSEIVGPGKQTVIAVAIGKFSMTNAAAIISATGAQASSSARGFVAIVERADSIVIADSQQPQGVFSSATPLSTQQQDALWAAGRYPQSQAVPMVQMPELATQAQTVATGSAPVAFTGAVGTLGQSQFGLVPVASAPWAVVVARPLGDATAISDQLTQLDIILFIVVAAATAALALLLGQSIIVPVRRLRERFRQVARQLVVVTRRQDEAAQRQEAALPPIETTAELLGLETDEVAATIFPTRTPRATVREVPTAAAAQGMGMGAPSAPRFAGGPNSLPPMPRFGGAGAPTSVPPGRGGGQSPFSVVEASPSQRQELVPLSGRRAGGGRAEERAVEALRQARNVANDWSLRQQRIMADLAAAHNATDELSRACLEGQREAVELGNLVAELLASAK